MRSTHRKEKEFPLKTAHKKGGDWGALEGKKQESPTSRDAFFLQFLRSRKNYQYGTEGHKRHENLAPVLVIIALEALEHPETHGYI